MLYNPLHYYDDLKVNLDNNKYCDFWQQLSSFDATDGTTKHDFN